MATTKTSEYDICQVCDKSVGGLKGLVAHVARARKCKTGYGEEYEKLRDLQTKARRKETYQRKKEELCEKERKRYSKLTDNKKEELSRKRKTYNDQHEDHIKKRQRVYNSTKQQLITEKQRKYNANNAESIRIRQTSYNKKHASEISKKQAIYDKKHPLAIAKKQSNYNKTHAQQIAEKQLSYDKKHSEKVAKKQALYNKANADQIAKKQSIYNRTHGREIASKQAAYNQRNSRCIAQKVKSARLTKKSPLKDFLEAVSTGPVYPCICCHRLMFLSGVVTVNIEDLQNQIGSAFFKDAITFTQDFYVNGNTHVCRNCNLLLKKGQRPIISACNGLLLDPVPPELYLTELEQQLIAKRLLFMKIFRLPRSRMFAIKDKVINVPLEDEDIKKTLDILPRKAENAGLLNVQLKRMKKLKNYHLEAYVRPDFVQAALKKLKDLGNPHYINVEIRNIEKDKNETDSSESDEEESFHECDDNESQVNNATCLVHESPESLVVVNNGTSTVSKKSQPSSKPMEIAPGEGKIPTNWLREIDFDVKGFPVHFPSGRYGADYDGRRDKISKQKYFNQRLLNKDGRFGKDIPYLFASQQRVERESLERQFDIVVQKGQVTKGQSGESILSTTDSFAAFQKVPGTPKYWQTARNEILAKVAQLGPFQLFFTLSCGELRWPEITAALLQLEGHNVTMNFNDKKEDMEFRIDGNTLDEYLNKHQVNSPDLLRENILTVTRMFDHRVKKFINHIVMSPKSPFEVEYYNYRVEFQMRGMAHIHGVMWLSKKFMSVYLSPESLEYDRTKLPSLIDKVISCKRPEDDETLCKIVDEVQTHHHTKSCHKYGDYCRFNFPRLPSDETIIATPLSSDIPEKERAKKMKELKSVLKRVRDCLETEDLDENTTLEDLLVQAGVSYEHYKEALRTSERGTTVILRRTVKEKNINNYNPIYLRAWNANMDVQFCHDYYAVITYICDYYGKDDTGMTGLLKEALKSVRGESQKEQLHCLKNTYLTHRQIGACEAVYRLLPSLHMKDSNVTCIFVSTGFPENRSVFMKRVWDSDEDNELNSVGESIKGKDGVYEKSTSIHDRYAKRPKALEDMNLAEFATSYKSVRQKNKKLTFVENSSVETGNIARFSTSQQYPLQIVSDSSNFGVMQLRKFPSVLRIHESKKKKEEHEYCYAELLLFWPWRDERSELCRSSADMCLSKFKDNFQQICSRRKEIFPFSDSVEEAQQRLEEVSIDNLRSSHIGELLDCEGQQEQECDEGAEGLQTVSVLHPGDFEEFSSDNSKTIKDSSLPTKYKSINIDDMEELYCLAQQLVSEQQQVFYAVIAFCKKVALSWVTDLPPPEPLRIILHGGAGTGKSCVIRAISKWAEKILRKAGNHPQKPRILLTAPTGMAASIIGGTTLHSAFNFNYGDDLKPLSDKKMDEMRNSLSDLKLLILDEMSMVRSDMLYQLHVRLCDIFQNNQLFGGISILLVGDLLQLKPVKGSYIFEEPRCEKYKPFHDVTPLWNEFDVYTLQHNHRQGQGNDWAKTLNRLRVGDTEKDGRMLAERVIDESEATKMVDACHIFYTNKEVDGHNSLMLEKVPGSTTSISAIVTLPFGCKSSDQFGRVDKTTFMRVLQVKPNARVMLIHNVDVVDNLCNGALGTVLDIIMNDDGSNVRCIVIEFDSPDTGMSQRTKHQTLSEQYRPKIATPIFRTDFEYQIPRGKGSAQHSAMARLLQFPLRLAWAVTAHKVQGQTFKKGSHIVVHWHSRLTEGMAYVMLGRCQDPADISITGSFNLKSIKCNEAAKKMSYNLDSRANVLQTGWKDPRSLKLSLLNTRCFSKHRKDLECDFIISGASIVCLTETWLQPNQEDKLVMEKHPYVAAASKGRGKGCGVMSQQNFFSNCVIHDDFQVLSMTLTNLQIVLIYRSSQGDWRDLLNTLAAMMDKNMPVVLLGDFNAPPQGNKVWSNFISRCQLHQVINQPSHEKGGHLDHLYISRSLLDKASHFLHYVYFSDHFCINLELCM